MIHPSSGLVGYRNLTVPFRARWLQPFRRNDSHYGKLQALRAPKAAHSHHSPTRHDSCPGELLLAFQMPQNGHHQVLRSPPLAHPVSHNPCSPQGCLSGPLYPSSGARLFSPASPKEPCPEKKFSRKWTGPTDAKRTLLSLTSSHQVLLSMAKSESLGSLVNQRDAQGQWLHTFMPVSKGNSLSESSWPKCLYIVLTDYKLKHPLPFLPFNRIQRPRALHSPRTAQSLVIKSRISHSTYLRERGSTVQLPCPYIGKKQEHTGSTDKETYLYLSLKAQSHQWSYFNMKLAANKGLVSALSCGKPPLRDFTGILTEGQLNIQSPWKKKIRLYAYSSKWKNSVF